jgi:hypothetical protein
MRFVYSFVGVIIMMAAAGIYALGPLVDFADSLSVERFVQLATTSLGILGLAMTIMGVFPPRRKKRTKTT